MESITITFKAPEWQDLKKTGGADKIASHTVNYIKAHFNLGQHWADFERVAAVWFMNGEKGSTEIDEDGNCVVPAKFLDEIGNLEVNLCGTNYENGIVKSRLTTYPITALRITKKAAIHGEVAR